MAGDKDVTSREQRAWRRGDPVPDELKDWEPEAVRIELESAALAVSVWRSERDGVLVVQIDGPGDEDLSADGEPLVRVLLNDEVVSEP